MYFTDYVTFWTPGKIYWEANKVLLFELHNLEQKLPHHFLLLKVNAAICLHFSSTRWRYHFLMVWYHNEIPIFFMDCNCHHPLFQKLSSPIINYFRTTMASDTRKTSSLLFSSCQLIEACRGVCVINQFFHYISLYETYENKENITELFAL